MTLTEHSVPKLPLLHRHPPVSGQEGMRPVGQTVGAAAQSGDRSWQLAGSEVLGGLTGQEQKQKMVELIGACPEACDKAE